MESAKNGVERRNKAYDAMEIFSIAKPEFFRQSAIEEIREDGEKYEDTGQPFEATFVSAR